MLTTKTITYTDPQFPLSFAIRNAVFVQEQGIPLHLELDSYDPEALHIILFSEKQCIGSVRVCFPSKDQAKIGRLAVLKECRGLKGGKILMEAVDDLCISKGIKSAILHAQVQVVGFYGKLGYSVLGDEAFEEDGVMHRLMEKKYD